jgi:hypothetical protein
VRTELGQELRGVRSEVHELRTETHEFRTETNARFDLVQSTLLDLAEQQRFVVRYTRAIAEREARLEPRVDALEGRVDKLESK